MNLRDARENYYTFTSILSNVNRQLCFAGIAVVWILVISKNGGGHSLPVNLPLPLWCFVLGLSFDLVHYIIASASWGIFHRHMERTGLSEDSDFQAPSWINWAPIVFFVLKVLSTLVGYGTLLGMLRVFPPTSS